MSEKQRYPAALARAVGEDIQRRLEPACDRSLICGSLRRGKAEVGDVEIVYQPRLHAGPRADMFAPAPLVDEAEPVIAQLLGSGIVIPRLNKKGFQALGPKNKLLIHAETGVPIDLFGTQASAWWNYVVCRTGGSQSNIAIASAARRRGWKWNPYGEGFSRMSGLGREIRPIVIEREVFEFVGLPFLQPEDRQ